MIRLWQPGAAADAAEQGTLLAHTGAVTGLAYRPAENQLISAGGGGTIKWWQLPFTQPTLLPAHESAVRAAALSDDGMLLATGTAGGVVRLTDRSGEEPRTLQLEGQAGPVASLALDSQAALLAPAGENGRIKLWDTAGGADRLSLAGHEGAIHDIALHPAGNRIASAGADGTLRLWRLPQPPTASAGHTMPVSAVAVSSGGKPSWSVGRRQGGNSRPGRPSQRGAGATSRRTTPRGSSPALHRYDQGRTERSRRPRPF